MLRIYPPSSCVQFDATAVQLNSPVQPCTPLPSKIIPLSHSHTVTYRLGPLQRLHATVLPCRRPTDRARTTKPEQSLKDANTDRRTAFNSTTQRHSIPALKETKHRNGAATLRRCNERHKQTASSARHNVNSMCVLYSSVLWLLAVL